ncbi:MAG: polyprenol monophosphomannose synthase [Chloroflexi bacterium]|nr:polyprenol monophosphomannose synthase [Anaerolineaceae bacterium]MCY4106936.1 polyprenol monophosphomannose synthase [Chloroflexota bacterium]
MRIFIVIPTYNEVENLHLLVDAILELAIPDLGILIVDDDSPDGTGHLADELASQHLGVVRVLHRQGDKGFRKSLVAGLSEAMNLGAEIILQMDADFSHPPQYIASLLDCVQGEADVAIGSRYVPGGSTAADWHPLRRALSRFANQVYVRSFLRMPICDATGGFRAYKRSVLTGLGMAEIRSNGYSFQVESIYRCFCLGYRIEEVPIHFPDRIRGTSKMNWQIALEAAWRVLLLRWRYRSLRQKSQTDVSA